MENRKIKITKEQYMEFERIRVSGDINMWDTETICELTDLKFEQVEEIRSNYSELREKFIGELNV